MILAKTNLSPALSFHKKRGSKAKTTRYSPTRSEKMKRTEVKTSSLRVLGHFIPNQIFQTLCQEMMNIARQNQVSNWHNARFRIVIESFDVYLQRLKWPQGARRPFDFHKNSPPTEHVFFGAKWHGEQCLLKSFCSLWRKRYTVFEKKTFWLLNKVLEGRQVEKSLLKKKCGQYQYLVRK